MGFLLCNILIPLFLGAYIYIYWDTDSYFGNMARIFLMVPETNISTGAAKIMRNWGCDFLYAYALFYALYANTKREAASIRYAVVCAVGFESLQLIHVEGIKCGTFDVLDIVVEIAAICCGVIVLSIFNFILQYKERRRWR